jgi:ABC-2 type transport system permease protein
VRIVLRFLFYLSPVLYGTHSVPGFLRVVLAFNPLNGILSLYRGGLFARGVSWVDVAFSVAISLVVLLAGFWTFARLERAVLKEI